MRCLIANDNSKKDVANAPPSEKKDDMTCHNFASPIFHFTTFA
jgi:hypothetical protein